MVNKYLQNRQILQNKLAEIIRNERTKRNKSISLISNEIGMTKSMWADTERGIKDPQFSTLFRMSEGLEIPVDELIQKLVEELPEGFSLVD